jgi:hypothetical protein
LVPGSQNRILVEIKTVQNVSQNANDNILKENIAGPKKHSNPFFSDSWK